MSIMPLSEFSGEKNESRENRVMRWRERYYRQEACIAALKAQRDELLAVVKKLQDAIDAVGFNNIDPRKLCAIIDAAIANAERPTGC